MSKKNFSDPDSLGLATDVLRRVWGYPAFRPAQEEALRSVLSGRDVLAILPTGGGKSLLYQVPALLRDGLTVVVSPLIALMNDQVRALGERGVAAAALAGPLAPSRAEQVLVNAVHGAYRLLYLAPERLEGELFRAYADRLNVALLAVDEAHCVSEWSRSFRPAYRRIPEARTLLGDPQTIAVTATATPEVRADIADLLGLRDPSVLVQGFARDNLALTVERCDRRLDRTVGLLRAAAGQTAIVYAATRRTTEGIAHALNQRGIASAHYHGGLSRTEREAQAQRWMSGAAPVIVATNAFGMGIDKSDVRLVVHAEAPASLEAYYQEAGRAGRDGAPARAHLLWQPRDLVTHEQLADAAHPDPARAARIFDLIGELAQVAIGDRPEDPVPVRVGLIARTLDVSTRVVAGTVEVLIRQGVLEEATRRGDGVVRWSQSIEAVRQQVGSDALLRFVDALARALPREAWGESVPVRIAALARRLRMEPKRVRKGLRFLSERGVLSFTPYSDEPWVRLLVPRSRRLSLDLSELERSGRMLARRRAAIERFLTTELCRTQFVLGYFGQSTARSCGRCDVCQAARGAPVERDALYELLRQASDPAGLVVDAAQPLVGYLHREGLVSLTDPMAPRVSVTERGRRWLRRRSSESPEAAARESPEAR